MLNSESRVMLARQGGLPGKWKILIAVIFGVFMVVLDTTVVNVAFQAVRADFGATLNDSQWIISIYVLALGISTPLAGFLADRFGIKRVYLAGLGVFALGSLLCGLAPSLLLLTVARAIQGFGGGVALPLGVAVLLRTFPPAEQGLALGVFGVAALMAPAVGPILGGYLVDQGLWRAIFFINPPIGLLGIVLGSRFLPLFGAERQPRLDVLGLATEVVGFGAVLYGASVAANVGWDAPEALIAFGVGVVGLVAFGLVELFVAPEPLLDLRLFIKPIFLNASLLGYVSVIALFGAEFLLPIYLQTLRGVTALGTGLILLPLAVLGGGVTVIAGRLYDRIGPRPIVIIGFAVLIVNTWQLSLLTADTPIGWIVFLVVLRGVALGCTLQTTLVTALSVVPLRQVARGSSLINATRQVVQAIGVAALATILASTLSPQVAALQNQYMEMPHTAGGAPVSLCEPPASSPPVASVGSPAGLPSDAARLIAQACQQSVAGFERAYRVTFFAALLALALGVLLPGWPLKWGGRRAADAPLVTGH